MEGQFENSNMSLDVVSVRLCLALEVMATSKKYLASIHPAPPLLDLEIWGVVIATSTTRD